MDRRIAYVDNEGHILFCKMVSGTEATSGAAAGINSECKYKAQMRKIEGEGKGIAMYS